VVSYPEIDPQHVAQPNQELFARLLAQLLLQRLRCTLIMGKKKQFVNKNATGTHTFQVVHRSQRDPRLADGGSSSFVLQPVVPLNVQRREQDGGEGVYMDASRALQTLDEPAEPEPTEDDIL
jgi:hypothetical protein